MTYRLSAQEFLATTSPFCGVKSVRGVRIVTWSNRRNRGVCAIFTSRTATGIAWLTQFESRQLSDIPPLSVAFRSHEPARISGAANLAKGSQAPEEKRWRMYRSLFLLTVIATKSACPSSPTPPLCNSRTTSSAE